MHILKRTQIHIIYICIPLWIWIISCKIKFQLISFRWVCVCGVRASQYIFIDRHFASRVLTFVDISAFGISVEIAHLFCFFFMTANRVVMSKNLIYFNIFIILHSRDITHISHVLCKHICSNINIGFGSNSLISFTLLDIFFLAQETEFKSFSNSFILLRKIYSWILCILKYLFLTKVKVL